LKRLVSKNALWATERNANLLGAPQRRSANEIVPQSYRETAALGFDHHRPTFGHLHPQGKNFCSTNQTWKGVNPRKPQSLVSAILAHA
jgi:hypothetical protein